MKYVYILESLDSVGVTDDLRARLAKHNADIPHFEVWALADKDLHRVQRRSACLRIREVFEVRLRPSVCQEALLIVPALARVYRPPLFTQRGIQLIAKRNEIVFDRR